MPHRTAARLDRYRRESKCCRCDFSTSILRSRWSTLFATCRARVEEKNRLINEAEGYRNEQVRWHEVTAKPSLQTPRGIPPAARIVREGDASRFIQTEQAFRAAPGPNETRMYLETMEQVLPGKRKLIMDSSKGRRHLLLMDDGSNGAAFCPAPLQER